MKYSLCIEPVFTELPFYERFQVAKDLGCDAVEFWEPWNRGNGITPDGLGRASAQAGIPIAVASMTGGDLFMPWHRLKENLELSFAYANQMGTNTLIGMTGNAAGKTDARKVLLLENLKRTAELAEKAGITIVVEALNTAYDHKGYYLDSAYVGFDLCKAVDSPNIKLLYDCYHIQLMEGNLTNQIVENIDCIGHFHSAGVPGRHELQLGEINYPYLIEKIEKTHYAGYFGFEYFPTYDHNKSVSDILKYLGR